MEWPVRRGLAQSAGKQLEEQVINLHKVLDVRRSMRCSTSNTGEAGDSAIRADSLLMIYRLPFYFFRRQVLNACLQRWPLKPIGFLFFFSYFMAIIYINEMV